jgi:glycosyltransferase involved in cell wall biosynthesis
VRTGVVAQADAPRYLAASDVLVSPHVPNPDGTPFFGSPTKLFEYMAMGKPIVASALDQIAQVLTPSLAVTALPEGDPKEASREVAILSEPGNVDELVQGIRFLIEHPAWRTRLGECARAEALTRYTWDKHVGSILERMAALDIVRVP